MPSRVDVNTHVSPAPTWQRCVHAWGKEENGVENVPAITPDPHPQKRKGCSHSIRNCHVTWQSSKKLRFNHINAGILHRLLSVDRQNTSERTGVCHLKFQTGQVIRPATPHNKTSQLEPREKPGISSTNLTPPKKNIPRIPPKTQLHMSTELVIGAHPTISHMKGCMM